MLNRDDNGETALRWHLIGWKMFGCSLVGVLAKRSTSKTSRSYECLIALFIQWRWAITFVTLFTFVWNVHCSVHLILIAFLVCMERATNELLFVRHTITERISINHFCHCVLWTVHIFRIKEITFKHQIVVEPPHKNWLFVQIFQSTSNISVLFFCCCYCSIEHVQLNGGFFRLARSQTLTLTRKSSS